MNKITIIAGARPNFMKIAPIIHVILEAKSNGVSIDYRLIHTGQHYDPGMSTVFFEEMGLPKPYAILNCGNLKRDEMLSRMKDELKPIFDAIQPDIALVYGDTN